MNLWMRTVAATALLAMTLAGCGGGKSTNTTNTTNAPMSEGQRESQALPLGNAAPVPAGLNCGAVQPVWVNMHTKAWHEPGDPYYGKTKNGRYMCPNAAAAAGFHAAGSKHGSMHGASNGAYGETTGTMTGKHRKRYHNSMGAPDATPTP
ncbi:MAG: hypothetical protein ABR584_00225 [Candidatus Baltobacteraceae bacterium]